MAKLSTKKQVFISFHYKSGKERVQEVMRIIESQNKYAVCKELEKSEPDKIREWIDEKIRDTKLTIILFNSGLVESEWVEYEIKASREMNNPFMFLLYEEDGLEKDMLCYMEKYKLRCPVHIIHKDKDLEKITEWIDEVIRD